MARRVSWCGRFGNKLTGVAGLGTFENNHGYAGLACRHAGLDPASIEVQRELDPGSEAGMTEARRPG